MQIRNNLVHSDELSTYDKLNWLQPNNSGGKNHPGHCQRTANEYSYSLKEQSQLDSFDDVNWSDKTIVGIPVSSIEQLSPYSDSTIVLKDDNGEKNIFKIRLAQSNDCRSLAGMLIRKMYAWRGYEIGAAKSHHPHHITLVASTNDVTVATITIGFDSSSGLLADKLYQREINQLRKANRRLCEFTKLAIDHTIHSKRVLASLFHIAYQYARRIYNYTDLLIEVNPRHVRFYEKMLGFKRLGPERLNRRVNASAVLLRLELEHAQQQIAIYGGQSELNKTEKSLYPYFFSPIEEANIRRRLMRLNGRYLHPCTLRRASAC